MLYSGMVQVLHQLTADAVAPLAGEFPSVEFIAIPRDSELPDGVAGDVLLTSPIGTPRCPKRYAEACGGSISSAPASIGFPST